METKEIQEKARHFLEGERNASGRAGHTEQIKVLDYLLTLIRGEQEVDREVLVTAVVQDFFGKAKVVEVLGHLENAAWRARRPGGCHSPRSEVLTIWAKHLRSIIPATEEPEQ